MPSPFDVIPDNGAPATAILQTSGRFSWTAKYPINNDFLEGFLNQPGKIAVDPGWFIVTGSGLIYGCAKAGIPPVDLTALKALLAGALTTTAVTDDWLAFSAAPTVNHWFMNIDTGAANATQQAITAGLMNWAIRAIINDPSLSFDGTDMSWTDDVTVSYDGGADNAQAIAAYDWMQAQWSAWQP